MLIVSILLWNNVAEAGSYTGTAGGFSFLYSNSLGCNTEAVAISNISIQITSKTRAQISFTATFPDGGTTSYSESGTISGGSVLFDRSGYYRYCSVNDPSRRGYLQASLSGISFTGSTAMSVTLNVSIVGAFAGSSGAKSALLSFSGRPSLSVSPVSGNAVCSSDIVYVSAYGDTPTGLSLFVLVNGGSAQWVTDVLPDNSFDISGYYPVKISDYFPGISDLSIITFQLLGFPPTVTATTSLVAYRPLPSGITLTTDKGDNPLLCEPAAITLSLKNAPAAVAITWTDGGPTISNPETKTYHASVRKTTGGGIAVCPAVVVSTDVKVFIFTPVISPPPATVKCQGETIDLVSNPSGTGYVYTWKKDDQEVGNENTLHANSAGSYSVTLKPATVDCPAKTSAPITLSFDTPIANLPILSPKGKIICGAPEATSVELDAQPDGVTYDWQRDGGGFTANQQKVNVTQAGHYTVNMSKGACSIKQEIDIQDNNYDRDITPPPAAFCSDTPITLTAKSNNPAVFDYEWKRDGTVVGTNAPTLLLTADLGPHKYLVNIKAKDTGCAAKPSLEISVQTDRAITGQAINVKDKTRPIICGAPELSIDLLAAADTPVEGISYQWQGPGISGVGNTLKASAPGEYKLTFTRGACSKVVSAQVESGAFTPSITVENAMITSPADVRICEGKNALVKSSVSGTSFANTTENFDYAWYGGSSATTLISTQKDANLQLSISGQYRLEMTLKGSGCPAKKASPDPIKVSVDPEIKNAQITPDPAIICNKAQGLTLTAKADSTAGVIFQWSGGGTVNSDPSKYVVFNGGTYSVTFTRGACKVSASVSPKEEELTVSVTPPNNSKPILLCSGINSVPVQLTASSNLSTAVITWMRDGSAAPGSNTGNSYTPTETGNYYATANFDNICTAVSDQNKKIPTEALNNFSVEIVSNIPSPACDDRVIALSPTLSEPRFASLYQYEWSQDGTVVKTGIGAAGNSLNTGRVTDYPGNTLFLNNESSFTLSILKDGCKAVSQVDNITLQPSRSRINVLDFNTLEASESMDQKYQWYVKPGKVSTITDTLGYSAITSATAQRILGAGPDSSYIVRANRNGCGTKFSFAYTVDHITAINPAILKSWQVYPNPTMDAVTVENQSNHNPKALVEIWNSAGQLMINKRQINTIQSYSLRHLPPGFYFIQIGQGNEKVIRKILKQ